MHIHVLTTWPRRTVATRGASIVSGGEYPPYITARSTSIFVKVNAQAGGGLFPLTLGDIHWSVW